MANTDSSIGRFALAIDGLGQATGIALLVYGLVSPKTVLVRNDLAKTKPTVAPVPMVASTSAGMGFVGTF